MSFRSFVKLFIPKKFFKKIEPYGHLLEAVIFNTLYGFPARKIKVIGVTGTNGKTSTSYLIHSMLRQAGYNTGLMTTVAYGVNEDIKLQQHHMTNVTVPDLMKRLKAMKKAGVEWLVLETTSQGLAQNRVWGVPYSVAVMTNITRDHLSWHGTFERYRAAKVKLFQIANRNHRGLRLGIINADDPNSKYFKEVITNSITYGIDHGEARATNVKLLPDGVDYQTKIDDQQYHIRTYLAGSFYVYNSLAAVCVGHSLGLKREQIEQGIAALKSIEGRMTPIDEGQDFRVIVDYAHTPDSFEKLFKDMQPNIKGRLIVVFGSLGGGDVGKRYEQGKLAGQFADIVIVTEEDDRKEDPSKIAEDIARGVEESDKVRGENLLLVHDRSAAIQQAVDMAMSNDMVMLLGKGHEKTIEHADGEHSWNEADQARKALKNRLKKS